MGRLVPSVDEAIERRREGFDFICYSGDVWALYGAVRAALDEIRERAGETRS
jgi:2-dehydro-3-deoxyglucarate aldolase/4-hydroxy-2-oxoheptanedioate aldolase